MGKQSDRQGGKNRWARWGFAFSLVFAGVVGLPLSIIGLVKSKQLGGADAGLAKAGIIISVASMILVASFLIYSGSQHDKETERIIEDHLQQQEQGR